MKKVALALLLLSLAACGDGDSPPAEQPGTVPPAERNWDRITLMVSICAGEPGEPTCQGMWVWSVDDEGRVSNPESPGPDRLTDADLAALDDGIDAVKNTPEGLACEGGPQESWDRALSIRFSTGADLEFYRIDRATGQECFRGPIAPVRGLYATVKDLWFKYNCGCFDQVCVDCIEL
jgi:hypothetical protein